MGVGREWVSSPRSLSIPSRAATHSTSQAQPNWPHNLVPAVSKLCGQFGCALPVLARGGSDDGELRMVEAGNIRFPASNCIFSDTKLPKYYQMHD
jgi:hypothetical protein